MNKILIYTDGGARGNPGVAGAGAVISDERGNVLAEISDYLGDNQTNNYAEYEAIILALQKCIGLGLLDSKIEVRSDSKLAVEQLSGRWRVKDASIREQFSRVKEIMKTLKNVTFTHIRREFNMRADELANLAMDKKQKK